MEWIVVTASSVDEARTLALDRLGVAAEDADVEVLAEATSRLFGLRSTPAQVRARVRPVAPPPKQERERRAGRQRSRGRDTASTKKKQQTKDGSGKKKRAQGQKATTAGAKQKPQDRSAEPSSPPQAAQVRKRQLSNTRSIDASPSADHEGTAPVQRRTRKIHP